MPSASRTSSPRVKARCREASWNRQTARHVLRGRPDEQVGAGDRLLGQPGATAAATSPGRRRPGAAPRPCPARPAGAGWPRCRRWPPRCPAGRGADWPAGRPGAAARRGRAADVRGAHAEDGAGRPSSQVTSACHPSPAGFGRARPARGTTVLELAQRHLAGAVAAPARARSRRRSWTAPGRRTGRRPGRPRPRSRAAPGVLGGQRHRLAGPVGAGHGERPGAGQQLQRDRVHRHPHRRPRRGRRRDPRPATGRAPPPASAAPARTPPPAPAPRLDHQRQPVQPGPRPDHAPASACPGPALAGREVRPPRPAGTRPLRARTTRRPG